MLCVKCRQPLSKTQTGQMTCEAGHTFKRVDGIWRMLPDATYEQFLREYEHIREAEGRGSSDSAHYQALPYPADDHPQAAAWAIRAQSYEALLRHLIPNQPTHILDLGAGSGWLSHRLTERGHTVTAVDLSHSPVDGLGALRHYPTTIQAYQAPFERLPFPDGYADIAIFNASLHYTADAYAALQEALRVTRRYVVVMDTPVYQRAATGEAMVAERHAAFEAQYGFRSDTLPMINYLTWAHIERLGMLYQVVWVRSPFRRLLRRVKVALLPGRPPAQFPLIRFG